jgi:hypothetical protein
VLLGHKARLAATQVNRKDTIMFMQDFTRHVPAQAIIPTPAPALGGILGSTLIDTAAGWRPADSLRIGDHVQTWDGGAARVLGLDRRPLADGSRAIVLPGGLFDVCSDLVLLPDQHLLLDTGDDPAFPDALAVLIPARALEGRPGIRSVTLTQASAVTPLFADEEILWAQSGARLHCPAVTDPHAAPDSGFFTRLSPLAAARFLDRRLRSAA